jgi:hypothetical protein
MRGKSTRMAAAGAAALALLSTPVLAAGPPS